MTAGGLIEVIWALHNMQSRTKKDSLHSPFKKYGGQETHAISNAIGYIRSISNDIFELFIRFLYNSHYFDVLMKKVESA